jgi:predicted transcriptional regulator
MSEHLKENIKLRLDTETLRALERIAEKGYRNVSQEMRKALREHVARHEENHDQA